MLQKWEKGFFHGWNSNQTIIIENYRIPYTWDTNWNRNCNAKIILADYLSFAQEYLESKKQEELEELILKTEGYTGTFEEYLTNIDMTREEWEQQATDKGMSYIEWLKDCLINGNNSFSWLQVEFEVSKQGGTGKTVEELETLFAQKMGAESFDNLLAEENMTKEQFLEGLKSAGFRSEEDFLKAYVYFAPNV